MAGTTEEKVIVPQYQRHVTASLTRGTAGGIAGHFIKSFENQQRQKLQEILKKPGQQRNAQKANYRSQQDMPVANLRKQTVETFGAEDESSSTPLDQK